MTVIVGVCDVLAAQTPTRPAFEAASIKPFKSGDEGIGGGGGGSTEFRLTNTPLRRLNGFKDCTDGAKSAGGTGLIASCGPNVSGSMASVAQNLSLHTDRAVVDQTGLTGQYTFMLEWAPEGGAPGYLPSLFTAIQDQTGLKLEAQRAPVDTIVIDRAEKPTPN